MTRQILAFTAVLVCAILLIFDLTNSPQPSVSLLSSVGGIAGAFVVVGWRGAMGQDTGSSHVILTAAAGAVSVVTAAFTRGVQIGTRHGYLTSLPGPLAAREIITYSLLAAGVLGLLWWAITTTPGMRPPRRPGRPTRSQGPRRR